MIEERQMLICFLQAIMLLLQGQLLTFFVPLLSLACSTFAFVCLLVCLFSVCNFQFAAENR